MEWLEDLLDVTDNLMDDYTELGLEGIVQVLGESFAKLKKAEAEYSQYKVPKKYRHPNTTPPEIERVCWELANAYKVHNELCAKYTELLSIAKLLVRTGRAPKKF